MTAHPSHRSVLVLLFIAGAGSFLCISTIARTFSLLRHDGRIGRRLSILGTDLGQFNDPKSVLLRSDAAALLPPSKETRNRCQIVYIMGVEGATHHGFLPIIDALARQQVDINGNPYDVIINPRALKAGLFGWFPSEIHRWGFRHETTHVDDLALVQRVLAESCPNDGKKHVLIEWASFPSGHEDDPRTYRVRRRPEWLRSTPEEIANSDSAINHPTNLHAFYEAYSKLADVKFVVLHRPFLETVASHADWDGGPETHSNVLRGFMILLRRFLDAHSYDSATGEPIWTLVCVERIFAKFYGFDETKANEARGRVLSHLAEFLGWPRGRCPGCFD